MSQSIPVILEGLLPYPWLSSRSRPLANRLSRERMPLTTKQRSPSYPAGNPVQFSRFDRKSRLTSR
jgi:hypothetical protein